MDPNNLNELRCPHTKQKLKLEAGDFNNGRLVSENGDIYNIKNGIPFLIKDEDLYGTAKFARDYYAGIASSYDENVDITFKLYNEEESAVRNKMIQLLNLEENQKVLEVSTGTGKDAELIAKKIGSKGAIFCFDISPDMLKFAEDKLKKNQANYELICGTAVSLPFADNSFDSLFCFTGVGHFPDLPKALKEMARVVKKGGKVVFGEKNVPPWLKETTYGKICINNNPMFNDEVPLKHIPIEARELGIRWINGNVHYVIDYTVGEGEPHGNFDLELPGARGGTFNTRYYGKLEGVTQEAKELAQKAREKAGISMHKWLDQLIKAEASRILKEGKK